MKRCLSITPATCGSSPRSTIESRFRPCVVTAPRRRWSAKRRWAAVFSASDLQPMGDPHAASAMARVGAHVFVSSILPWRGCGDGSPWVGEDHAERTRNAVEPLASLPHSSVIWGGDWNHALEGPEHAGSKAGRTHVLAALETLELAVPTATLAHAIPGLRTIDHSPCRDRPPSEPPNGWWPNTKERACPTTMPMSSPSMAWARSRLGDDARIPCGQRVLSALGVSGDGLNEVWPSPRSRTRHRPVSSRRRVRSWTRGRGRCGPRGPMTSWSPGWRSCSG